MASKETVQQVLQSLVDAYEKKMTPAQQKAYQDAFSRIEDSQLEQAAQRHIESSVYFPRVAEIVTKAKDIPPRPAGNDLPDRIMALWKQRLDLAGKLDPIAWADLAEEFRKLGLVENHAYCLSQVEKINQILKDKGNE